MFRLWNFCSTALCGKMLQASCILDIWSSRYTENTGKKKAEYTEKKSWNKVSSVSTYKNQKCCDEMLKG